MSLEAFIIKWILDENIAEDQAAELLSKILHHVSTKIPMSFTK